MQSCLDTWAQFQKLISSYKVRKCNEKIQRCKLRTTNSCRNRFCETGLWCQQNGEVHLSHLVIPYSLAPGTSGYLGLSPVARMKFSAVSSISLPFLSTAYLYKYYILESCLLLNRSVFPVEINRLVIPVTLQIRIFIIYTTRSVFTINMNRSDYSRTSMARTLMACLPRLFRTRS